MPIIASIITGAIVAFVTWLLTSKTIERNNNAKIGNASQKAKEIIDTAQKEADNMKKEAEISAKEEVLQLKNELESEVKERRNEVAQYEKRVIAKEESLEKKSEAFDQRDRTLSEREAGIEQLKAEVEDIKLSQQKKLEELSGITADEAKEYLLSKVEQDVREDKARIIKNIEAVYE